MDRRRRTFRLLVKLVGGASDKLILVQQQMEQAQKKE